MRYLVLNSKEEVVAVFMYEHNADWYANALDCTVKEIATEDIHDYM